MRHNTLTLPLIHQAIEEVKKRIGVKIKPGKEAFCFVCMKKVKRGELVLLEVPYNGKNNWTACSVCYPAIKKERLEIKKKKIKDLNDKRRGLI
jgi:hypothetical protein